MNQDLFKAITLSAESDTPIQIGRFQPRDPQMSYWEAVEAAQDYIFLIPRASIIGRSKDFWPEYARIEFVIGAQA